MTKAQAAKRFQEAGDKIGKVLMSKHSAFMGKSRRNKLNETMFYLYDMADFMKRK